MARQFLCDYKDVSNIPAQVNEKAKGSASPKSALEEDGKEKPSSDNH